MTFLDLVEGMSFSKRKSVNEGTYLHGVPNFGLKPIQQPMLLKNNGSAQMTSTSLNSMNYVL